MIRPLGVWPAGFAIAARSGSKASPRLDSRTPSLTRVPVDCARVMDRMRAADSSGRETLTANKMFR